MRSECQAEPRPALLGYSEVRGAFVLMRPGCHMWGCPYCGRVKQSQWAIRIATGVDFYKRHNIDGWAFLTLTSNPKNKTRSQCLHVWPKAWAKFSSRLRRSYPGIRYVLLPELHKNGRVHVHALASHYVTSGWLRDNLYPTGLGYKKDIQSLSESALAAWYVTKYLSKSLDVTAWPRHFRRIRRKSVV